MAFFSGLYSNATNNAHILAPVPIHTIPASEDFLYLLGFKCQRMDDLQFITDKSQHIQALLQKHHLLLSEVSNKTQIPISYYQSIYFFDAITIEVSFLDNIGFHKSIDDFFKRLYGLPIPTWITPEKSAEFDQLFVDYVSTQYGLAPIVNDTLPYNLQLELARISSGALIAEIVDRLKHKIRCLKNLTADCSRIRDQKLYTYSGHDITVVELFSGLGFKTFAFKQQTLPSYGATIILELWEDESITNSVINVRDDKQFEYYYVKIYYYENSTVEIPKNIGNLLPECQGKGCPISYLIKRAELIRPKPDLKSYCNQAIFSLTSTRVAYNIIHLFISVLVYYCWTSI
uniref:2-phosphoxylose phosphatase 1 n=1 Tax=Panagrolaimus superbus TaxID=310955 RepID=A0A914Y5V6_9BILA